MGKVSRFRAAAGAADDLVKRTKESYNSKDSSGKFELYISKDIPIPQWKCKEGDHILDILPWMAGPNHPTTPNKGTYLLDVWVHKKVGVSESDYLCLSRNYGKPCPICEDLANLKKARTYDEQYVKDMSPKRRVVYCIQVYDSAKEEEAGPYWWEASHFLSEKNIVAIAKNRRTGGYIPFSNPDTGKTVEFTREGSGATNTKYAGFKFTDRDYVISDDLLDKVPPLEDYLIVLDYEDLAEKYFGAGGSPDDTTERDVPDTDDAPEVEVEVKVSRGRSAAPKEEEMGEVETTPPATERRSVRGLRRSTPAAAEEKAEEKAADAPPPRAARGLVRRPAPTGDRPVRTGVRGSRRGTAPTEVD